MDCCAELKVQAARQVPQRSRAVLQTPRYTAMTQPLSLSSQRVPYAPYGCCWVRHFGSCANSSCSSVPLWLLTLFRHLPRSNRTSYPVSHLPFLQPPPRSYIDATESEEKGVCCVPVAEYFCSRRGDIAEVLHHFHTYHTVWAQLGRRLTLDTEGHPALKAYMNRH